MWQERAQRSVKPMIENSPLPMAGRPALHASTIMVNSSMSTNMKPAMEMYSSCSTGPQQHHQVTPIVPCKASCICDPETQSQK